MSDLLRPVGSTALATAAYSAGLGAVAACGCVTPIPETQAYVARILGLMGAEAQIPVAARGATGGVRGTFGWLRRSSAEGGGAIESRSSH
jgi:hypothetical protein